MTQFRAWMVVLIVLGGLLAAAGLYVLINPSQQAPAPRVSLASAWQEAYASRVRLESAATALGDGYALTGLHIALDEGWKTYWREPGDSGLAPQFDWSGSRNVRSVEILWPAPRAFDEAGQRYYGYKDDIVWPLRATATDPAEPLLLSLKLDYGVCADVCVPASISVSLQLPPGDGEATLEAAGIERALNRLPQKAADADVSARLTLTRVSGHRGALAIEPRGAATRADIAIVTGMPGIYFGASQPYEDKGFQVPVEAADPAALRGQAVNVLFLERDTDWAAAGTFFIE